MIGEGGLLTSSHQPGEGGARLQTVAIAINEATCKACELCIAACPEHVLALAADRLNDLGYHPAEAVAPQRCTGCIRCARMCPETGITILLARVGKVAAAR